MCFKTDTDTSVQQNWSQLPKAKKARTERDTSSLPLSGLRSVFLVLVPHLTRTTVSGKSALPGFKQRTWVNTAQQKADVQTRRETENRLHFSKKQSTRLSSARRREQKYFIFKGTLKLSNFL